MASMGDSETRREEKIAIDYLISTGVASSVLDAANMLAGPCAEYYIRVALDAAAS